MIQSRRKDAPKPKRKKQGYVYVATNRLYEKIGIYKIGNTKNVANRMKTMCSEDIFDMYPVLIFHSDDCRKMEKQLHKEYSNCRIRSNREWFQLDSDMIQHMKMEHYDSLFADKEFIESEWLNNSSIDVCEEVSQMWYSYYEQL